MVIQVCRAHAWWPHGYSLTSPRTRRLDPNNTVNVLFIRAHLYVYSIFSKCCEYHAVDRAESRSQTDVEFSATTPAPSLSVNEEAPGPHFIPHTPPVPRPDWYRAGRGIPATSPSSPSQILPSEVLKGSSRVVWGYSGIPDTAHDGAGVPSEYLCELRGVRFDWSIPNYSPAKDLDCCHWRMNGTLRKI